MCEPITITAITTATATAVASASASAAAAASAVASAAAAAASAVGSAVATVGSALGIGGAAAGGGGAGAGAGAASLGTGLGGSSLSIGAGAGTGGSLVAPLVPLGIPAAVGAAAAPTAGLTLAEGVALVGLVGGVVSSTVTGVQQTERNKQQVKGADKDAASKRVAALQSFQQSAEASAQQQFEAQRAALQAKGVIKASNLGDRSVRALSRAVGFELGQTEATITRNQQIASLETSGRLFGINQQRNARIGQVGSGLTVALNSAAGGIRAGANALEIRNRLSN